MLSCVYCVEGGDNASYSYWILQNVVEEECTLFGNLWCVLF